MLPKRRHLSRDHFAFMRAVVQGLDARESWTRYMLLEGAGTDLRLIRKAIAQFRDEFSAAARRHQKPGTARLVLMDMDDLQEDAAAAPSLEEFAAAQGLEDFSTAEQLAAYEEAHGQARRGGSRRSRLIARQLEALRWLEDLEAQDPKPGDPVSAWLSPNLANRLELAGVPTLFALVERINGVGARWWGSVPGIGAGKGGRILEWLKANESTIGLYVGAHVAKKRTDLQPAELDRVVPPSTALVPLEKFLTPPALNGSAGQFRAPREACAIGAANDLEAVGAWLDSKRDPEAPGRMTATQRAYRKEAERLLLWSVLVRKKALSSLTVDDANAFVAFLQAPPAPWCGPRHHERWSPLWRPLEGPLSGSALRMTIAVLGSLFSFLSMQHYSLVNPFAGVATPKARPRPLGSGRALSIAQWQAITAALEAGWKDAAERRVHRAIRWLYALGLRRAELVAARCTDLQRLEYLDRAGAPATGWLLQVEGKGRRYREVPVPGDLVGELAEYLQEHGRPGDVTAEENGPIPILASLEGPAAQAWTAEGLYKALRKFFKAAGAQLGGAEGARLAMASAHWLRHTHGTHASNGRNGRGAVDLLVVRNNLGHASLQTTSGYLTTERDQRIRAMEEFWRADADE